MKIKISNFHLQENHLNEVTSSKIFKPRRSKDKYGNWRFHDEGIFSRKIFGRLYKCGCGENTEVGTWCSKCGDRVVSKDRMPDFYIDCGVVSPFKHTDYTPFGKNAKSIKNILEYRAFVYEDEVVDFDLSVLNIEEYSDMSKMCIGIEAAKQIDDRVTDEWIARNTSKNIPVPHPIYRPIIERNSKDYVLGKMNQILVSLLEKRSNILSFKEAGEEDKFQELTLSSLLYSKYMEAIDSIFDVLLNGKKSIMKQEVLAQPISSALRAIITNNDSLDEDTILIGYELVPTLFPDLHKKHKDDYDTLNEVLREGDYKVLANRPPTIGEKSIVALKPVINTKHSSRFVVSTNSVIFDGMAADTDGDAFLVISLYSKEANEEAESILPSKNYIGGSNGNIRNKMPEDFVYAMSQIYKNKPEIRDRIKAVIKNNLPL